MLTFYKTTVKDLKHGDIFKFRGTNCWDSTCRFDSLTYFNDKIGKWQDFYTKDCRICFHLLNVSNGKFYAIKWSDTNSLDEIVYIPQYPRCEWKRLKGQPCIPHGNHREIFSSKLNDINISTEYCITGYHY